MEKYMSTLIRRLAAWRSVNRRSAPNGQLPGRDASPMDYRRSRQLDQVVSGLGAFRATLVAGLGRTATMLTRNDVEILCGTCRLAALPSIRLICGSSAPDVRQRTCLLS